MNELLPIADGPEIRAQARSLGRRHRRALLGMVGLHAAAATAGLAGPPLLGALVQSVQDGTTQAHVDKLIGILAVFLVAETVLTWFARRASFVLSEKMFAELAQLSLPPDPQKLLPICERYGIKLLNPPPQQ